MHLVCRKKRQASEMTANWQRRKKRDSQKKKTRSFKLRKFSWQKMCKCIPEPQGYCAPTASLLIFYYKYLMTWLMLLTRALILHTCVYTEVYSDE